MARPPDRRGAGRQRPRDHPRRPDRRGHRRRGRDRRGRRAAVAPAGTLRQPGRAGACAPRRQLHGPAGRALAGRSAVDRGGLQRPQRRSAANGRGPTPGR